MCHEFMQRSCAKASQAQPAGAGLPFLCRLDIVDTRLASIDELHAKETCCCEGVACPQDRRVTGSFLGAGSC